MSRILSISDPVVLLKTYKYRRLIFRRLYTKQYCNIFRLVFRMSPPPAYDPTDDVIDIINKLETRRELKMMDRDEELTEVINYSITSASDIFHGRFEV